MHNSFGGWGGVGVIVSSINTSNPRAKLKFYGCPPFNRNFGFAITEWKITIVSSCCIEVTAGSLRKKDFSKTIRNDSFTCDSLIKKIFPYFESSTCFVK